MRFQILAALLPLLLAQDYSANGANWVAPCAPGNTQSPISITDGRFNDPNLTQVNFELNDWTGALTVETELVLMTRPSATTSRVEVEYSGSKCAYTALRFEFHAPSEHQINTLAGQLEVALIFQRDSSACTTHPEYLGVSVLLQTANQQANTFLTDLGIPSTGSGTAKLQTLIESVEAGGFYTYAGSLTSDTCAETTYWLVAITRLDTNTAQMNYFTTKWSGNAGFAGGNGNNRAVQTANGRGTTSIPTDRVVFNQPFTSGAAWLSAQICFGFFLSWMLLI